MEGGAGTDYKAFNISDKIERRHFPNVLSGGQSSRNVKELRESDAARGQDRIDKSLKEYQEFRAVMKETIQEPGKDQKAPKEKKEKKDKGKEKAVEEDEEEVEEDDDSAWLANKRKEALAEEAPAESTKSNVCPPRTTPPNADCQLSNQEQLILSSRRLFVRNLAFVTTRDELRDYFSTYGPIEECHLPVSKDKQQPLGTAYILFKDANDALEAYRKLDRRIFQGRILQVIASEPKNGWYGHSDPEFASHVLGKSDKAKGEVKKDIQKKSLENVKWAELYLNVSLILQHARARDVRTEGKTSTRCRCLAPGFAEPSRSSRKTLTPARRRRIVHRQIARHYQSSSARRRRNQPSSQARLGRDTPYQRN